MSIDHVALDVQEMKDNFAISFDRTIEGLKSPLHESMPHRIRRGRRLIESVPLSDAREIINRNVSLIKSISPSLHPNIAAYIKRVFNGSRTRNELVSYLERKGEVSRARAEMIADDQITKDVELFLVEKWKKHGVKYVKWVHQGANEPRKFHMEHWNGKSGVRSGNPNGLNGFIFPIDRPPIIDKKTRERGYPGQLINCHCHLEPVMEISQDEYIAETEEEMNTTETDKSQGMVKEKDGCQMCTTKEYPKTCECKFCAKKSLSEALSEYLNS